MTAYHQVRKWCGMRCNKRGERDQLKWIHSNKRVPTVWHHGKSSHIFFWDISSTWCLIWHACTWMHTAWRINRGDLDVWMQLQSYNISLGSPWCRGIIHTWGWCNWWLVRTVREGRNWPFGREQQWFMELCLGKGRIWLRACGSRKISCWNETLINLEANSICFLWQTVTFGRGLLCGRILMLSQDVQSGACDILQCSSWTIQSVVCLSLDIYNFQLVMLVLDLHEYHLSSCYSDASYLKPEHWF